MKHIDDEWRVVGTSELFMRTEKNCWEVVPWSVKPKHLERQGWRLTTDAKNFLHNWTCFFRGLSRCGQIWKLSDIHFYQGAEFVDVSQELPLHFLHRQIQTGIPKVKLEDQTLGPTQNIEDDTCKPHWLLSCDSVNQCWTRAWQILECYRTRQKGEFTGTSFAVKKVNLKLISSLTWSNTVLNDDPRCEKTCLKFRWLCKIKRWNLRQRQRERHLDCYSWALQVCQAPVEGQRWDNEGRAWSYSSESAAFQTYSPLVSQRNFPSEVKLNQSFNNQGSGGDLHMKMCKFTHCTRPFRGGSGSVTGYFSSSKAG